MRCGIPYSEVQPIILMSFRIVQRPYSSCNRNAHNGSQLGRRSGKMAANLPNMTSDLVGFMNIHY